MSAVYPDSWPVNAAMRSLLRLHDAHVIAYQRNIKPKRRYKPARRWTEQMMLKSFKGQRYA